MNEMDVKPWLIRMSQGDEEAFQAVYDLTRDQAYGLIYYLAPNKHDVPDIMSEVYIELFKSLDNYQQEQKFSSWFNGLIIRQVRNWKRKSWRRIRIMERMKGMSFEPLHMVMEDRASLLSDRLELLPMLEDLPLKLREVVVLRYYEDCTLEEIAQLLKIPLGTVKSRHHHALKRLRSMYSQRDHRKEQDGYVY
ncbi:sigma-70 family RNA polymerase sigma factor [Paenibacillus solani]|uniref:RNA polymerase n=1 Tax=Paenibacillus solani TaxID=1705565 RepID=A0A0M1P532_9BACL|nr:sigma-70 family RNA polymerase sigma factor [Paenibacillus solani]KOR89507.1 RNA polymerase [Paenibacillus solani]